MKLGLRHRPLLLFSAAVGLGCGVTGTALGLRGGQAVLLGWNIGYAAMSVSDRPVSTVFLTLAAVTLAAALGIVLGIVLQAGFGTKVPFGPPLLAGALFCMLYAEPILRPFG